MLHDSLSKCTTWPGSGEAEFSKQKTVLKDIRCSYSGTSRRVFQKQTKYIQNAFQAEVDEWASLGMDTTFLMEHLKG